MVFGFTGAAKKAEPEDATLNKYSLVFSFQELQKATDNFHESRRMGAGGFGAVYRGMQPDGTEIAIKALETARESGFEEEVRVLSMFRHPNLVTLMGFARNGPKRFLVYELMEGGDLFERIHNRKKEFHWRDRLCVAYDAACGLSHLHHQTPKVFHRDIKTMNILLTRSGLAKVADFGLAKISKTPGAQRPGDFCGTPGYICPIYGTTYVITERSEVFSFGVVLMELLTAWYACWQQGKEKDLRYLYKEKNTLDRVKACIDKSASWTKRGIEEVGQLALKCTHAKDEEIRPDFTELVRLLRGLRDLPEEDPAEALSPVSPASPPSPIKEKANAQALERPLFWFMPVVWVEDKKLDARRTIEWRAAERGMPIKVRNMAFGRTEYERFLQPILSEQLLKCISRKAFEIEVQLASGKTGKSMWGERMACNFQIRNLGKNAIAVGGQKSTLVRPNECTPLRDGDHISMCYCEDPNSETSNWVPFLVFQFRLTDPEDLSCTALQDVRNGVGGVPGGGYAAGCLDVPVA